MKYTVIVLLLIMTIVAFIPEKKRYFYVVYSAETNQQKNIGSFCFTTIDRFPNLHELDSIVAQFTHLSVQRSVITNIIELKNLADFNSFSSKP